MQINDKEIAVALRAGNENVFEQMFRLHYQRLCNYAAGILNDMDEAEEVVQQMFLHIWEKRSEIEISLSLKSYLYRAVHNTCLNRLKQNKVRKLYADEQLQNTDEASEHTSHTILKTELEKQIHKAINTLPEQCRIVFKLSRIEEMKYAEIATHLGISIKTVENHMGKALKLMREQLKDYLPVIMVLCSWVFDVK